MWLRTLSSTFEVGRLPVMKFLLELMVSWQKAVPASKKKKVYIVCAVEELWSLPKLFFHGDSATLNVTRVIR